MPLLMSTLREYVVVSFDARGALHRGFKYSAPLYRNFGGVEVRDALTATRLAFVLPRAIRSVSHTVNTINPPTSPLLLADFWPMVLESSNRRGLIGVFAVFQ